MWCYFIFTRTLGRRLCNRHCNTGMESRGWLLSAQRGGSRVGVQAKESNMKALVPSVKWHILCPFYRLNPLPTSGDPFSPLHHFCSLYYRNKNERHSGMLKDLMFCPKSGILQHLKGQQSRETHMSSGVGFFNMWFGVKICSYDSWSQRKTPVSLLI